MIKDFLHFLVILFPDHRWSTHGLLAPLISQVFAKWLKEAHVKCQMDLQPFR